MKPALRCIVFVARAEDGSVEASLREVDGPPTPALPADECEAHSCRPVCVQNWILKAEGAEGPSQNAIQVEADRLRQTSRALGTTGRPADSRGGLSMSWASLAMMSCREPTGTWPGRHPSWTRRGRPLFARQ